MEILWYGEGFAEENKTIKERKKQRRWVVRKASLPAGRGLADSNPASGSNQFQPED